MGWSWLFSLIYSALVGFTAFLPVSSDAHRRLLGLMADGGAQENVMGLFCRLGALGALVLACGPRLQKLYRESRRSRRRRELNGEGRMDSRFLRTGTLAALILGLCLYPASQKIGLPTMALLLVCNGLLLYLCRVRPLGNKTSAAMSGLDAVLTGAAGGFGVLTGLSPLGLSLTVCQLRGGGLRYVLDMSLLLCLPITLLKLGLGVVAVLSGGFALSLVWILKYVLGALVSCVCAYGGIAVMRFLSAKEGYSGFAFYCWGAAAFTLLLYLLIG